MGELVQHRRALRVIEHLTGDSAAPLIIGILVLALTIGAIRARPRPKDPMRMYPAQMREESMRRAGWQCEMSAWGILRCDRPARHTDHHYPHSRGGATSMNNAVASCVYHNTSKGARMPSPLETWLITQRRRAYFPRGENRRPGQWYK